MPVTAMVQHILPQNNNNRVTTDEQAANAAYRDPDVIMRVFQVMRGHGSTEAVAIAWAEFDAIVASTDPTVIVARLEATRRLAVMDAAELRANGAA